LPNLAALSDSQVASVKRFVDGGGNLVATGQTSLFTESGEPRLDFALSDLFGAHMTEPHREMQETTRRRRAGDTAHTYLRIESRHPVLRGFEGTDLLPFGGILEPLNVAPGAQVLTTFVPPFPAYPPESSWMREPKTNIPGLILNTTARGSRIAFLPADLDRRFGRDNFPDQGNLLANLVRWAVKEDVPLVVEGPGLIDCQLYQQPGRIILHLVNLTNAGTWRQPVEELIPVGPLHVRVKLPANVQNGKLRSLVSGKRIAETRSKGWASFRLESIFDHEVLVIG
jgi:hypothetical protein